MLRSAPLVAPRWKRCTAPCWKTTARSASSPRRTWPPQRLLRAALELVLLVLKQHVEGCQRTIRPRDVLLEFHLVGIAQFLVTVDLLLQHAQVVTQHHDLVEEH